MTNNRNLPICKSCRWYDPAHPQCFDGHLQYSGKTECDGFERPLSMEGKTQKKALKILVSEIPMSRTWRWI